MVTSTKTVIPSTKQPYTPFGCRSQAFSEIFAFYRASHNLETPTLHQLQIFGNANCTIEPNHDHITIVGLQLRICAIRPFQHLHGVPDRQRVAQLRQVALDLRHAADVAGSHGLRAGGDDVVRLALADLLR